MMTATDKPGLDWQNVAPQDHRATLPNGAEVRVSGWFVDDRDYDGGIAQWQWNVEIDGDVVGDCTYETKRDAMNAAERHVRQFGAEK